MFIEKIGFPRFPNIHRRGHICVTLTGGSFYIWGGYDEEPTPIQERQNELLIYDCTTNHCSKQLCTGDCPPTTSGASASIIGKHMYIFGGFGIRTDRLYNSLYRLDLETFVWENLQSLTRAEPYMPIACEECVAWSYNGCLFVFGGYCRAIVENHYDLLNAVRDLWVVADVNEDYHGWNNQFVLYNPKGSIWRWPKYSGKVPSARAGHSGALLHSTYYLFGGENNQGPLNDLYTLDLITLTWCHITTFSSIGSPLMPLNCLTASSITDLNTIDSSGKPLAPSGRYLSSLTPINDRELLLYGGRISEGRLENAKTLDDSWIFNIESHCWRRVRSDVSNARFWHTACRTQDNEVVIIGGCCTVMDSWPCSKILILALKPKSLKKLSLEFVSDFFKLQTVLKISNIPASIEQLIRSRKKAILLSKSKSH